MKNIRLAFAVEERQLLAFHFLAHLTQRGLPVVAIFLVARVLGLAEFGLFIAALTAYNALTLFADLGLSLTTTTRVGMLSGTERFSLIPATIFTSTLASAILGFVISGVLLSNLGALQALFFGTHAQSGSLAPGALYVPLMAVALVLSGALAGLRDYKALAVIGGFSGMLHLAMTVGAAIAFGAEGALWGAALGVTCRAVLCMRAVRNEFFPASARLRMHDITRESAVFVAIAVPASIAAFAFTPVNAYLLGSLFQQANGATEVGAFGVTQQLFSLTMLVPGILTQFFLPRMAGLNDASRQMRKGLVWQYAALTTLAALLIASPMLLFPSLVLGLLGGEYASYRDVLSIMMVAALVSAPQGVFSNYMLARGMNWLRVATWFLWATVVVAIVANTSDLTALSSSLAYLFGWCALTFLQGLIVFFDH